MGVESKGSGKLLFFLVDGRLWEVTGERCHQTGDSRKWSPKADGIHGTQRNTWLTGRGLSKGERLFSGKLTSHKETPEPLDHKQVDSRPFVFWFFKDRISLHSPR